ncbi:MAG TPA: cation-translocating P-type ATPase [bacterium]|nr:cation-translocating P-type ATPase [bacterium]
MNSIQFASYNKTKIYQHFDTSANGLNYQQANQLLKKYGTNDLRNNSTGWITILFRQINSPFCYLQIGASVISVCLREYDNAIILFIFSCINILLSFTQEYKAQQASQSLKKILPTNVKVIRENKTQIINKTNLVPGDHVILSAGNIVPADIRLTDTRNLFIDESTLTGESTPTHKNTRSISDPNLEIFNAHNIAFAGTAVTIGYGHGIVINTGKNTNFGQINILVNHATKESTYEKDITNFSHLILKIILITILFIFIINIFIKGQENIYDFIVFCIALVVSIVPEALPVVVSWSLSKGALKLAQKKVIVKRLNAIEDLGNIEILCTDKTGTLTENKLAINKIISSHPAKLQKYYLLLNKLSSSYQYSPFWQATKKNFSPKISNSYQLLHEQPFDSYRMISSALIKNNHSKLIIAQGAPENIVKLCHTFPASNKRKTLQQIDRIAKNGYRLLAIAYKTFHHDSYHLSDEKNLTFLGLMVFQDPTKISATETIKLAQKLGVQIKIISGDNKYTTSQLAQQIGLISQLDDVITGTELATKSAIEFNQACENYHVFARISPDQKYQIVKTLSQKYETGFLGDGINDTPAIKAANTGISVNTASDTAKEAADIILVKKDLKMIIEGIKEGRTIYANINKYIECTLASSFGNSYSLAIISLIIPYLPMLAIQLLLLNLLSDLPMIVIASDTVDIEELKKPKKQLLKNKIGLIVGLAIISSVFDIFFFSIFKHLPEGQLQTLWFIESILTEIVLIFSLRTSHQFLSGKKPGTLLQFFSLLAIFLTFALPYSSLGQNIFQFSIPNTLSIFIVILIVITYFSTSEIYKLSYFKNSLNK